MFRLRTARAPFLILAAAAAIIGTAAACGGDDDGAVADICDEASQVVTNQTGEYSPAVISSDLAVGQNRFVLGLLDADGAPVAGADLEAQFCRFTGIDEATLESEVALSAITVERSFTHIHDDGEHHQHDVGEIGVYVSNVGFSAAGRWQVFVAGTADGDEVEPTPFLFEVREASLTPAIGSPAPLSVQLLIDDVDDITEIDTSTPPNPVMHNMTIADAVTSGRPTVIVFASPAFCTSQICGPTKEVVDALYTTYGDRVNFVHVEPYDVARVRDGDCQSLSACIVPFITDEWRLQSEPWVFTIDANGDIAGKFEGVVGNAELEESLQSLLTS
jgi:hypothetical protein